MFIILMFIILNLPWQPEMAVKRAGEADDEERERPGRKRSRLEVRSVGPQPPPPSSNNSTGPSVPSSQPNQVVEEKLQQLEHDESDAVSL